MVCFSQLDVRDYERERVVDVYGSTSPSGTGARVPPLDGGHLGPLDLGSSHSHRNGQTMIVTESPCPSVHHDHNRNAIRKANSGANSVATRANKYIVDDCESPTSVPMGGHVNLAYDSSSVLGGYHHYSYTDRQHCNEGYESEKWPCTPQKYSHYNSFKESSEEPVTPVSTTSSAKPRLRLPDGEPLSLNHLMKICPFINDGTLFDVTVIKNSRGLGLSMTGGIETEAPWAGLVRIKKIYPQTPAWLCGQLEVGDIILEANETFLTGLTSHEALEVLRTTDTEVHIKGCRPPAGSFEDWLHSPTSGFQDPPVVTTSLTTPHSVSNSHLSPSHSFSNCGEFEIELSKVNGSLGFTLRKQDNSILGHTIRSLVKEPAISDGRMKSGDKILSVNGNDMCGLSHEQAVAFLRTCPETVVLRLYRDPMQTPVSPASPSEPDVNSRPKMLRHEARAMLTDLAFRKNSPSNSLNLTSGAGSMPGTPRRRRLQKTPSPELKKSKSKKKNEVDDWEDLVRESEIPRSTSPLNQEIELPPLHETSLYEETIPREYTSIHEPESSCNSSFTTNTPSKLQRPSFLDLSGRSSCPRKTQFTPPHELDNIFPSPVHSPSQYTSISSVNSNPQLTSTHSDAPAFTHFSLGYQSANFGTNTTQNDSRLSNTTSDHNLSSRTEGGSSPGKEDTKRGLLKWKGVVFTPEEEESGREMPTTTLKEDQDDPNLTFKPKIISLEMNRGWNSRLGFSIQNREEKTVIVAIYADSVAAKDGRLKVGDQILTVNSMDVADWKTEDIIELLRKTRGKITITVLQQPF